MVCWLSTALSAHAFPCFYFYFYDSSFLQSIGWIDTSFFPPSVHSIRGIIDWYRLISRKMDFGLYILFVVCNYFGNLNKTTDRTLLVHLGSSTISQQSAQWGGEGLKMNCNHACKTKRYAGLQRGDPCCFLDPLRTVRKLLTPTWPMIHYQSIHSSPFQFGDIHFDHNVKLIIAYTLITYVLY